MGVLILRRDYRLRDRLLTCGISDDGPNGFSVVTVPHWDDDGGLVETFGDASAALVRHAAITAQLKADGWVPAQR
jgi:hypothetical protein